ncbi:hypothetical protein SAMN05421780_11051 [Flexibacter flexilis DSM 6793]|uniref:Transglutaminase-like superfamily protein n=1 Tax=Flexibacter flexilis DSM 6793 TaxID=927664 RepID=A0A1I1M7G4_9BACT|nr:hypothetical protein [Flexibacter flexilis]SFC80986.1 hypothetical protein SAMN05421780_11051 [Flexibacter flexilis DSM 6793]
MRVGKRVLAAGGERFDQFFGPAEDVVITHVKEGLTTSKTVDYMKDIIYRTLYQTERIAPVLQGKNLYETCQNIWTFLFHYVQYQEDKKGVEQVRRPYAMWRDRITGVDCDCYTTFISSVLTNLRIPHYIRRSNNLNAVQIDKKNDYQHIYVVVPDGRKTIIIDPVCHEFNKEYDYYDIDDTYMAELQELGGLPNTNTLGCPGNPDCGCNQPQQMNGWISDAANAVGSGISNAANAVGSGVTQVVNQIGNTAAGQLFRNVRDEVRDGIKFTIKEFTDGAGKVIRLVNRYTNPATITVRNGVLAAMKVDLFNFAERAKWGYLTKEQAMSKGLSADSWDKAKNALDFLEEKFWQMGGKRHNLKKAILNGKGNKGWGGSYVVPMDASTLNNNEFEDEQEYALDKAIILTPAELALLCGALDDKIWGAGKEAGFQPIVQVNGQWKANPAYDWGKVYENLLVHIYGSYTDAATPAWNSVYYTKDINGNKVPFKYIESVGLKPGWDEARRNQFLYEYGYLAKPYLHTGGNLGVDERRYILPLQAMGIHAPGALPAITDKNGNPIAGSQTMGEPVSATVVIAAASGLIGTACTMLTTFKKPLSASGQCVPPQKPIPTGNADIDSAAMSFYNTQLSICAAQSAVANVASTVASTAVPTAQPASTAQATQTAQAPPASTAPAASTLPATTPQALPPAGSDGKTNNAGDVEKTGNTVLYVVGGAALAAITVAIISSSKDKGKSQRKSSGTMNGLGQADIGKIAKKAKSIRKDGEDWTSALSRAAGSKKKSAKNKKPTSQKSKKLRI